MRFLFFLFLGGLLTLNQSCVSKKKFTSLQAMHDAKQKELSTCYNEKGNLSNALNVSQAEVTALKAQLKDCKSLRDKQVEQVGNLTVLNQSANENIHKTLSQLEKKDKYIKLLQAAKSKADSINLALAVNLKSALKEGLDDQDVNIKVDKTVVMINLSDKMLFSSGSYQLSEKSSTVLSKIAQIIKQRSDIEVMVEGYTDDQPIKTNCIEDNWDLSVKRSTAVVRALQNIYQVNPNKLIAAGRAQYNALSGNSTEQQRAMNRRTRIIILPKIDQFYDLLDPSKQ